MVRVERGIGLYQSIPLPDFGMLCRCSWHARQIRNYRCTPPLEMQRNQPSSCILVLEGSGKGSRKAGRMERHAASDIWARLYHYVSQAMFCQLRNTQ